MDRRFLLRTPRLTLRPLEDADADTMIRMLRDGRIRATYMIPDLGDGAAAYFARLRDLSRSPERFVYGVSLDGPLIGFLNDCGMDGTSAELGYFIDPAHWGRGYATEALRAAVEELFRIGYARVTAGYFEGNDASRRVMEKCGMRPLPGERTIPWRGEDRRCCFLAIDRT